VLLVFGAPVPASNAGGEQEHGRTIPLSDIAERNQRMSTSIRILIARS
jgi:hypothetical protein